MGYPKIGDVYDGRFRIVRRIGHGGMGVVYEGFDEVLRRPVALKIVLPSLTDREDFHARFAHEASVLARVRSRHIVGIHDHGQHEDTVFMVTDLFPDGDLRSRLEEHGPLDRRTALVVVAEVCDALVDAHRAGIVHRDVKPGNVLLWQRPEGLVAYLCDFGIALDSTSPRQSMTRTGQLVGSPAYMAPERHFGHAADERGDVYSAGCLLWAALTGDAPYSGTDFQVISSHVNAPVPELGTGHPVDQRIDAVLAQALHKDPEQRISSAEELREALLSIVRDLDAGLLPAPPAPEPRSATPEPEHTRVRESVSNPPAAPPPIAPPPAAAPPEAPTADPTTGPASEPEPEPEPALPVAPPPPGRRRRLGVLVGLGVAAAVALAATVGAVVLTAGDDGPGDPMPTVDGIPSDPTSSAPTPLAAPAAPTVSARAAYRSVVFSVGLASPTGDPDADVAVELDRGDGWEAGRRQVRVPTEQGGERACLRVRAVATRGSELSAGPVERVCGRAAPRTVRLVRTPGACSEVYQGFTYPCQWYGVVASGFASGTTPLARLKPVGATGWCTDFDCQRLRVRGDGRASLPRYFKILRDSGVYVLDVDGVQVRARLFYR